MAPGRLLDRRVRTRVEEEDEPHSSDAQTSDAEALPVQPKADSDVDADSMSADDLVGEDEDEANDTEMSEAPDDLQPALKDITFGALAKAQESLIPTNNKRKRSFDHQDEAHRGILKDLRTQLEKTNTRVHSSRSKDLPTPQRSSKHAPSALSTRHAVSRKRSIFSPPPALKSRDPRFDAAVVGTSSGTAPITSTAADEASKNYSFLTDYRATELSTLKSAIKRTKDSSEQERLKRELMSLTSKQNRANSQARERDILRQHKKSENEAIKQGKKSRPYYLKKSDVKREMLTQKFGEMGKKQQEKSLKRKRKKVEGKEKKMMPRERRGRDIPA